MLNHQDVRRRARQRRRALSQAEQTAHALSACRLIQATDIFRKARHIAAYIAADGELDTSPVLDLAFNRHKRAYLPALKPGPHNMLWFLPYGPATPLTPNQFGIPEPDLHKTQPVKLWALDLVLMPLTAFDRNGHRIGMGGGYYDRTFAYLNKHRHMPRPLLFGYAHECQRVTRIKQRSWDIPLDGIITETAIYYSQGLPGRKHIHPHKD